MNEKHKSVTAWEGMLVACLNGQLVKSAWFSETGASVRGQGLALYLVLWLAMCIGTALFEVDAWAIKA